MDMAPNETSPHKAGHHTHRYRIRPIRSIQISQQQLNIYI